MELSHFEHIHFISRSQQHLISYIIFFHCTQRSQIFSINIFLLSFLDCLENLVKRYYFFIITFKMSFNYKFTLIFTTNKWKYLIYNVGFRIFFRIICKVFIEINFFWKIILILYIHIIWKFLIFNILTILWMRDLSNCSWRTTIWIIFLATGNFLFELEYFFLRRSHNFSTLFGFWSR